MTENGKVMFPLPESFIVWGGGGGGGAGGLRPFAMFNVMIESSLFTYPKNFE